MKQGYKLALALIVSLFAAPLLPLATVETKVAGIEIEKLMNGEKVEEGLHEWRDRIKDLQSTLEKTEVKLKEDEQKLKKLYDEIQELNKSKVASEETRKSKAEEFMKMQNEFQTNVNYVQEFRMKSLQMIQQDIFGKIQKTANELGQKAGWDLVVFGGFGHISKRVNMTDEVRASLDKEYDAHMAKAKAAPKADKKK